VASLGIRKEASQGRRVAPGCRARCPDPSRAAEDLAVDGRNPPFRPIFNAAGLFAKASVARPSQRSPPVCPVRSNHASVGRLEGPRARRLSYGHWADPLGRRSVSTGAGGQALCVRLAAPASQTPSIPSSTAEARQWSCAERDRAIESLVLQGSWTLRRTMSAQEAAPAARRRKRRRRCTFEAPPCWSGLPGTPLPARAALFRECAQPDQSSRLAPALILLSLPWRKRSAGH
jgi:hypothetical protein